jgi:putative Ca2+/H+ antiporter (TMEM165/GDT1 family)
MGSVLAPITCLHGEEISITSSACGMLLANAPVVFLGKAFATRLPLKAIHYGASCLFAVLGLYSSSER